MHRSNFLHWPSYCICLHFQSIKTPLKSLNYLNFIEVEDSYFTGCILLEYRITVLSPSSRRFRQIRLILLFKLGYRLKSLIWLCHCHLLFLLYCYLNFIKQHLKTYTIFVQFIHDLKKSWYSGTFKINSIINSIYNFKKIVDRRELLIEGNNWGWKLYGHF